MLHDDDSISRPQLPSPPSSAREDSMASRLNEQPADHGLLAQGANPNPPEESTMGPDHDPTTSPSSESSIEPVKKKHVRLASAKLAEQERTQLGNPEMAADSASLKAQIQRLNDRLREVEESGHANRGPELEDQTLEEDLAYEHWEGVPSRRANGSRGGLFQRNHHPKVHKEMMASEALMVEFEYARMEAHHPNYNSYDRYDPEQAGEEGEGPEEMSSDLLLNSSQLNYVSWEQFQKFSANKSPFAIDVLVGEPEPKVTPLFSRMLQPTTPTKPKQATQANKSSAVPIPKAPNIPTAMPSSHTQRTRIPGKPFARGTAPLPERIRINSPVIIHLLKKLSGMDTEDDSDSDSDSVGAQTEAPDPILMMQPFRALVYFKDEIRDWKERLEAEAEGKDKNKTRDRKEKPEAEIKVKDKIQDWNERLEAGVKEAARVKTPEPEAASGKEAEPEDNSTLDAVGANADTSKPKSDADSEPENESGKNEQESKVTNDKEEESKSGEDEEASQLDPQLYTEDALDDINCLIEFIDIELEGRITHLRSNDCQRIAFSDIWLLFKPGDFVLSRDGKQAYRVIKVEYCKHNMKLPSPRDFWKYGAKARLEDHPIKIQCVYVDFDGEQIGPVMQVFSFHRFEGEKSVRTLDIIPFRLVKDANKLQEKLIKRGSTFIEACGTGRHGIPMHYSGLTMDTKEEVDSQVVVDFEEAFTVHDEGPNGDRKRTGLTTEKLVLEILAHEIGVDYKKRGNDLILLQNSNGMALNWKPVIKDIDAAQEDQAEEDNATDSDSDSDSDGPGVRRLSKNMSCIPECCASETVYDDTYVEHRLSNEFIRDQFREHGGGSLAISPRPLKEVMEGKDFVGDSERQIVTYRVFGFIMRSRKWAQLDLTYLGPAKGENTFDLLVLPPGHRNMVESLVTQHYLDKASASEETDEMDIVRGKGKGLIILLHGAPGVGKTTTAECVATYFQKPLFQITCGDLGSTADVVESRLEKNFTLASRWGCILLIDEADVFLEARQTENFDRNSLVAVFLRTLEYYTGILFLTTNRVGTFDEAFTSRVHISLYYPPLDAGSTLAVFKVNLDRIKERFRKKKERGVAELELDERSINTFNLNYYNRYKDARWNGRQIRNACQTALALAEFEAQKAANPGVAGGRSVMDIVAASTKMIKVKMSDKHFRDVAKAYLAFMKYLREVHGMSAAQQARSFRLRHDRYGMAEPNAGLGLLASRQRRTAGGGGEGRQRKPVQKQGLGRKQTQWPNSGLDDEFMEEGLGEFGYGEENLYGQGWNDDVMLDEREEEEDEQLEEDLEDEHEEDPEYLGDDADFDAQEDGQDTEDDEDNYWNEQLQRDDEYTHRAQPNVRPQATSGSRGQQTKYRATATTHRRGDGLVRGEGVTTAAGRSSGLPTKASRGDPPPLSPGHGRGRGAVARGRGQRVTRRPE